MNLSNKVIIILEIILITGITVIGDSFLKRANNHFDKFINLDFILGLTVYALTAFAWVFVYKAAKFSLSGVIYSLFSMLAFVVIGTVFFREKLSTIEYFGVALGVSSVLILSRFI